MNSGIYRENLIIGQSITLKGLDNGSGMPILAPAGGRIVLAAYGASLQGFELSGPRDAASGNCTLEVVLPAVIYMNDFAGKNSICPEGEASWNSTQKINYQYKSQVLRGQLGNYWADYIGTDDNQDGIGDEPMVLNDKNIDYYPLIEPASSFIIPDEKETKVELIHARIGQPFTIALPANPTTGYSWYADYDYVLLNLQSSQYEKGPSEAIGGGGSSVYVFMPQKAGKTTIAFVYKRSWENIMADTRTFHVEITA
ncbi:Chagasin family peptidase inhibitor I42 [uncultured archaeon]|nr:Chagasin family peptidase inhibitor I42 [uncultured archaeon]